MQPVLQLLALGHPLEQDPSSAPDPGGGVDRVVRMVNGGQLDPGRVPVDLGDVVRRDGTRSPSISRVLFSRVYPSACAQNRACRFGSAQSITSCQASGTATSAEPGHGQVPVDSAS